jgi:hypothetical protein
VRYGAEIRDLSNELVESEGMSPSRLIVGLFGSAAREWVRLLVRRPRQLAFVALVMAIVLLCGGTLIVHHSYGSTLTVRNMPTVGGRITLKGGKLVMPDYIKVGVGDKGRIVGYEPSSYLMLGGVAPVYARDLHTLVGHEYPDVGFVPLGVIWTSLPCRVHVDAIDIGPTGKSATSIACPSTTETVPTVVGSFTPTAMGALSGASLSPVIKYIHSDTIAAGHIVTVAPKSGTKVPARSVVTVVSSLGPAGSLRHPLG